MESYDEARRRERTGGVPRLRCRSAYLPEVVSLAELDTVVTQQVVGGRHVKEEVRQRPVAQEDEPVERKCTARCVDRYGTCLRTFELLGLEPAEIFDRTIDARHELGEGRLL